MKLKQLGPWRVESVYRLHPDAQGFQIMDGDDVLVEMFEDGGWNKVQMKKILNLMAAAPQMKSDIDAFLWHWDRIDTQAEAADLCKDMVIMFRASQRLAEGKKK